MNLPRGLIGILAAAFTFLCIGIPLHRSGVGFLPAFAIQLGVMAVIILCVLKIQEKIQRKRDKGRKDQ